MSHLQNWCVKISCCFLAQGCLFLQSSWAQPVDQPLHSADSLFALKKYTESFALYEQVLHKGMATPQMLMKMAYIKEGLDEYPEALFYLTRYHQLTLSDLAMTKIAEVAEKQHFQGYEITDADRAESWYARYYDGLLAGLMSFIFVLVVWQVVRVVRRKAFSTSLVTCMLIAALILGAAVNCPIVRPRAIIIDASTCLMKGPSAGAPMLGVVSPGHKVKVLGEGPVWTKIQWQDAAVYVRTGSLKRLG